MAKLIELLCELACCDNIKECPDIINCISVNNQSLKNGLDIKKLAASQRIRCLLACNFVTKKIFNIDGVPKQFVTNFCSDRIFLKCENYQDLFALLLSYLKENTFVRFLINPQTESVFRELGINCIKYLQNLEGKPDDVKKELIAWLCRGSNDVVLKLPTSLLQAYSEFCHMEPTIFSQTQIINPVNKFCYKLSPMLQACTHMSHFDHVVYPLLYDCMYLRQMMSQINIILGPDTKDLHRKVLLPALLDTFGTRVSLHVVGPIFEVSSQIENTYVVNINEYESIEHLNWVPRLKNKCTIYVGCNEKVLFNFSDGNNICFVDSLIDKCELGNKQIYLVNSIAQTEKHIAYDYLPLMDGLPFIVVRDLLKIILSAAPPNENQQQTILNNKKYVYKCLTHSLIKTWPLSSQYFKQDPYIHNKKYAVVLIDTRVNGLSILSLLVTLGQLKFLEWNILIITATDKVQLYRDVAPFADVRANVVLDKKGFDIEAYNTFMMDKSLWETMEIYERILIIQDDGCIIRPGLETSGLLDYDYVGGPWMRCNANKELTDLCPALVGNGGLCIRNPQACKKICEQNTEKILFNHRVQQIQEDVFFSMMFQKHGQKVPTDEIASKFSSEQVLNNQSLGFHKIWMYYPMQALQEFFKNIF
jgi:hypothetical protein